MTDYMTSGQMTNGEAPYQGVTWTWTTDEIAARLKRAGHAGNDRQVRAVADQMILAFAAKGFKDEMLTMALHALGPARLVQMAEPPIKRVTDA
jgi:hypothetical protein